MRTEECIRYKMVSHSPWSSQETEQDRKLQKETRAKRQETESEREKERGEGESKIERKVAEGDKRTTHISRAVIAINIQMITWSSKRRRVAEGLLLCECGCAKLTWLMGPMESVVIALLVLAISICFWPMQAGGRLVLTGTNWEGVPTWSTRHMYISAYTGHQTMTFLWKKQKQIWKECHYSIAQSARPTLMLNAVLAFLAN